MNALEIDTEPRGVGTIFRLEAEIKILSQISETKLKGPIDLGAEAAILENIQDKTTWYENESMG